MVIAAEQLNCDPFGQCGKEEEERNICGRKPRERESNSPKKDAGNESQPLYGPNGIGILLPSISSSGSTAFIIQSWTNTA